MRTDIFLRDFAWQLILNNGIDKLPVDVVKLAENLGIGLVTYGELTKIMTISFEEVKRKYGDRAFCFISSFFLNICAYNETMPEPLMRWAVMHEIAHIALGHVTKQRRLLSYRNRTDALEREAQGVARRVLCPSIILHECNAVEVEEIMTLCGISREAAQYRSEYIKVLEKRKKFETSMLETKVKMQFENFIKRTKMHSKFEFAEELLLEIA